jgi:ribosomal protein L22
VTPPDQVSGPPEEGWESLKVDELKQELEARGLPKSGNKAELIARLEDDEVAQKASAPAEEQKAEEVVDADEAQADEDSDDSEDSDSDSDSDSEDSDDSEETPAQRRRGSAETTTTERKRAPREADGSLVVSARARYVRSAPRKARLVMDHIRGKRVEHAQAILQHAPRAVSDDILKLLNSAVANAESAYELGPDELKVRRAFVDEGPTIKRYRPRALGRATRINKRTSHMTIELTTEGTGR